MKPKRNLLLLITFFVFLSLNSFSTVESDLASERAALVTLRDAVGGRSLLWNLSDNPCQWVGVFCDQKRTTVVELRLPGMGLSGQLPVALGNLTSLQTLSVRFNALSGPIPADIGNIVSLRNLYLQGNFFSGEIPEFLFRLQNLVRLNLANNNFSGVISPSFNNLTRLDTLYLEENQLTGSIPDLNLPLDQFNVSFNNLTGPVPLKLSNKPVSSFQGTLLCGKPLVSCNGPSNGNSNDDKLSGGAIAGIVVGCVRDKTVVSKDVELPKEVAVEIPNGKPAGEGGNVSAGHAVAVVKSEAKSSGTKNLVFFGNTARSFGLEDLLKASAEVLGKGTFGTAYKATLDAGVGGGCEEAEGSNARMKSFLFMITCPWEAYLQFLHGNKGSGRTPLNWEIRSGIALGAARGIAYVHSQGPAISHGNIKSSNILLTTSFEARVSDFGLAHLAGTYGHSEPYRWLSCTGNLPRWVQSVVKEEWTAEVFDQELLQYQTVEEDMVQLLQLAIDCTAQYPDNRPSMSKVRGQIEDLCRSSSQEHDIVDDKPS
ncbi:hypothetical protein OIU78_026495 [Salix suchowensis]|nr:hypothetical protein OIU78_026495 [Salix suchowensis]